MRILVKAKPGAKVPSVKNVDGKFFVAVKEHATEGRANRAIEKAIAKHFKVSPSRVRVVSGHTAREKVLEII